MLCALYGKGKGRAFYRKPILMEHQSRANVFAPRVKSI